MTGGRAAVPSSRRAAGAHTQPWRAGQARPKKACAAAKLRSLLVPAGPPPIRRRMDIVRKKSLAIRRASSSAAPEADGEAPQDEAAPTIKVHWCNRDGEYDGWGLHAWGAAKSPTDWMSPIESSARDDFGVIWTVPTRTWTIGEDGDVLGLLVHIGEQKDTEVTIPKNEIISLFDPNGKTELEVWIVSGSNTLYYEEPDLSSLPVGDLSKAKAHWVSKGVIAWRTEAEEANFRLHFSHTAALKSSGDGILNCDAEADLVVDPSGLPADVLEKYPFLGGTTCLRLPESLNVDNLVLGQLAVAKTSAGTGLMMDCTGLQIQGVIDDCYSYDGPLGCTISDHEVSVSVWAPTSCSVDLLLYPSATDGEAVVMPMAKGDRGVWTASGSRADWTGKYYTYRLRNFSPFSGYLETCEAPDPYSRSVSADGRRTQIVDINASDYLPETWSGLGSRKPELEHHADCTIYELHIRDFSIFDEQVPAEHRGKYLAFEADSHGTRHLADLSAAGLSHVHLLPCYDFATVPERAGDREEVDASALSSFPRDSEEQQRLVMEKADQDGFNWGYDPVLYGVPEGSYATDGAVDGAARLLELRRMVTALNGMGLRAVVDVVYNHLAASGPHSDKSVYDKIVPGYYLRRSEEGDIENSTCCNNTASENYMVDRLIVDDLVHWTVNLKVDGFRFDLMGHIMLKTLERARSALNALTLEEHGVDGSKIIMYGEGWEFGEVANCARGVNGSQPNLGGTGIGSFNDRVREPTVGGGPFRDPRIQGFATGLALIPWPADHPEIDQGDKEQQLENLLYSSDKIRLGLAGNLGAYTMEDFRGQFVRGDVAHGGGIAYAEQPCETVNYVSAHDNETLFDMCVLKMPQAQRSTEERIRANWLCTSLVALGHGIPFFHAGDELLRSKSLDRDSYNSGDWFNRLDFTGETHNLGVGLPPAGKNREKWPYMREILSDEDIRPSKDQILGTTEKLKELLQIRHSTSLLGLREAKEVMRRVRFPNSGRSQIPGLIVMEVVDKGWSGEASDPSSRFSPLDRLCAKFARVVVAFNARPEETRCPIEHAAPLVLHPLAEQSADPAMKQAAVEEGELILPALSTSVFVEMR